MALKDQYSTSLGLSVLPEIDQQKYPQIYMELLRMRTAFKTMQLALDSYTGALSEDPAYWNQTNAASTTRLQNIARVYAIASEAISIAQTVNFYNNAGVLNVRKALHSSQPARAFCSTSGGVAAGAYGEFILFGVSPYFSSLVPGQVYYLSSSTPGQITPTSGTQPIGYAIDSNNLFFNPVIS